MKSVDDPSPGNILYMPLRLRGVWEGAKVIRSPRIEGGDREKTWVLPSNRGELGGSLPSN